MKRHPVFVVRGPLDEGCGHQHQTQTAAHNCAVGILTARKSLSWADVVRVRRNTAVGLDIKTNIVEHIEQWFGTDNAQAEIRR